MKIKFIEQMKFRMTGRSVPVIKCEDITEDGQVRTLHIVGDVKKRPNSLVNTWDEKGWEIEQNTPMITFIDEKGLSKNAYVVSSFGLTTNLYMEPKAFPMLEDVIGRGATVDDISDNMDTGKSNRKLVLGMLLGAAIGVFILAPAFQTILS